MDLQEFDYVIVGGGSAGCALAGRLSEDPGTTVCVLEAGGADSSVFVRAPLGFIVDGALGPDEQLALLHHAAEGFRRAQGLSAARQGAGRLELDQRDGVHPLQPQRLRRVGGGEATRAGATPTCCPCSSVRKTATASPTTSTTATAARCM
jgi:choline dehydrogenase-like flavoprotein